MKPSPIISPAGAVVSADGPDPYARGKHVRYFELGVPYHIVSRTRGNLFLLRPDLNGLLRSIFVGVFAEAKQHWENIANFASSALSNHMHNFLAAMDGDPRNIADYIAFIKRETCHRWRREVGWERSLWDGYEYAAVITPDAQLDVLAYVAGQGCQENLVDDPRLWPGFNCAESLVTGEPMHGHWFDGTGYGKESYREQHKKSPREVSRARHTHPRDFVFDKLPAFADWSDEAYRGLMLEKVEEVVADRKRRFAGPALGPEAVCAIDPMTKRPVPMPPWFEERRRFIAWDDPKAPEVKEYLGRYWEHQVQYRAAAKAWLGEELEAIRQFPDLCFVPGLRPRPIAHMEQSTG
jgi:hypothetical protein